MGSRIWSMMAVLTVASVNGFAAYGCSGTGDTSSAGATSGLDSGQMPESCSVSAPTECPDPAPKYADIAPIFKEKCVTCHSGIPNGPWPLTDYEAIADWQNEIRSELIACSMPPLDAGPPITEDERTLVLTWIRCGAPR